MKATIFIININNYFPELWNLCYPTIKRYADKINAKLKVITERRFPDWHLSYEKSQVYTLGYNNDWNIVMDADVVIHPDMPNLLERVPDYTVGLRDSYAADSVFSLNSYFYRDRRKLAISSTFAMASKHCHDLWTPFIGCQDDHLENIHPWPDEVARGVPPEHFITEYWLSNNLARFGLSYVGILHEHERWMFHHSYSARTDEQKFIELKETLQSWSK